MSDDLVKRLRWLQAQYENAGQILAEDFKDAADEIEEYERAFSNLHREYDARGDRIEELEAELKIVVEDKVDVVVKITKLQTYLEDFFILLDKTEETDEGRVFRPNHINSCRAEDGQKLENLLRLMKATVEGRW